MEESRDVKMRYTNKRRGLNQRNGGSLSQSDTLTRLLNGVVYAHMFVCCLSDGNHCHSRHPSSPS